MPTRKLEGEHRNFQNSKPRNRSGSLEALLDCKLVQQKTNSSPGVPSQRPTALLLHQHRTAIAFLDGHVELKPDQQINPLQPYRSLLWSFNRRTAQSQPTRFLKSSYSALLRLLNCCTVVAPGQILHSRAIEPSSETSELPRAQSALARERVMRRACTRRMLAGAETTRLASASGTGACHRLVSLHHPARMPHEDSW